MTSRARQKQETRERILASAIARMKAHGIEGASIADVMGALQLTVGGFYAHFASKDDLIDQSVRRAMSERTQRFANTVSTENWRERLRIFISRYLTKEHRDDTAGGCPMPSVSADVGRLGSGRAALNDEVSALVEVLGGRIVRNDRESRESALGSIALCVGGLTLARALGETPISDEILAACRAFGDHTLARDEDHPLKRSSSGRA